MSSDWNALYRAPRDAVLRHESVQYLRDIGLPARDFVVAGSAPLLLRGLRDDIADVDVVARGRAWQIARRLGPAVTAPYQGRQAIKLAGGRVEILDGWFPQWFRQDDLFARADQVCGMNFLSLEDTRRWKVLLGRDKDRVDLRRLAEGRKSTVLSAA